MNNENTKVQTTLEMNANSPQMIKVNNDRDNSFIKIS